jgi:hypothetical protein
VGILQIIVDFSKNIMSGRIENLTPFKKGHAALKGCGRPKGSFSFGTIIKKMLTTNPEKFLNLCAEDKTLLLRLKKHGIKIKNVKDLISLKVINKAADGDLKAIEWIAKQVSDDVGEHMELRIGHEKMNEIIASLTNEQLLALANGAMSLKELVEMGAITLN